MYSLSRHCFIAVCICCAPFWNLHRFGVPKWDARFEMVLDQFGTPSLALFQNGAAPFWNTLISF